MGATKTLPALLNPVGASRDGIDFNVCDTLLDPSLRVFYFNADLVPSSREVACQFL